VQRYRVSVGEIKKKLKEKEKGKICQRGVGARVFCSSAAKKNANKNGNKNANKNLVAEALPPLTRLHATIGVGFSKALIIGTTTTIVSILSSRH
jgi:hypothetical protein